MWAPSCNWVLIAIDLFVHGVNPQASWLCGSTLTMVQCWPHKVELASADVGAWQDLPLDVLLVQLTGCCSDVWAWQLSVFALRPLERTLLRPMSEAVWTTHLELPRDPQCAAASAGISTKADFQPWRTCPHRTSNEPKGRSAKAQGPPQPASLPGSCLLGSVTKSDFDGTWVPWGRFSVSH